MATRAQVLQLLDQGHSYETAARELDLPAGQVFMIATGQPADGGDSEQPADSEGRRLRPESPQQLVNPAAVNPTRNDAVLEWVRERATRELEQNS